ncbi:hypothetical protein JW887_06395 [Candidatus Dojkabacteria bacterium]|nr:hypothetical protein [Candidatus Dojkabacteria bacterium]
MKKLPIKHSPSGQNWLFDEYTENAGLSFKINKTLEKIITKYQDVKIVDSLDFGTTLIINNWIYRTEQNGSQMPEMIVHVPMNTGFLKKHILLIGGGDGYSLNELLKYKNIESVDMIDIDERIIEICRKHFPIAAKVLKNKKVKIHIADGAKYLESYNGDKYDLILVTGTEPFDAKGNPGISHSLFSNAFYKLCSKNLSDNGIMLTDGQMGYYGGNFAKEVSRNLKKHFPIVKRYMVCCKYIPGGMYIMNIASKKYDPETDVIASDIHGLKYYNSEIHKASFKLPTFLK